MLARDLFTSLKRCQSWLYVAYFAFLIRYRKTILGPTWLVVGPALFVAALGFLFSDINGVRYSVFVPYMATGLIVWTLVSGFLINSATVFERSRPQILQGGMSFADIIMVDVFSTILQFLHQIVIIIVVFLIFGIAMHLYALVSLIGLALLVVNGIWLSVVFGIVGARYRDLDEIIQAIMRIAFLATPIIWMPGDEGRGGLLGVYLTFNPFFHALELVRAPLLGDPILSSSWLIVLAFTVGGILLAHLMYTRFSRQVPLWV